MLSTLIIIFAICFVYHYWHFAQCLLPWKTCATDTTDTHTESFSVHALGVSLELLLAFMMIEIVWKHHERKESEQQKQEEKEKVERERRRQLRYIKSHMFQAPMLTLFKANFRALEPSTITIANILNRSYCREDLTKITYKQDDELKGRAIAEYIKLEKEVWQKFLELGILFGFGQIIVDMTEMLRSIQRIRNLIGEELAKGDQPGAIVDAIRRMDSSLLHELETKMLKPGIFKFIEYVEELHFEDHGLFESLVKCYARHDEDSQTATNEAVHLSQH